MWITDSATAYAERKEAAAAAMAGGPTVQLKNSRLPDRYYAAVPQRAHVRLYFCVKSHTQQAARSLQLTQQKSLLNSIVNSSNMDKTGARASMKALLAQAKQKVDENQMNTSDIIALRGMLDRAELESRRATPDLLNKTPHVDTSNSATGVEEEKPRNSQPGTSTSRDLVIQRTKKPPTGNTTAPKSGISFDDSTIKAPPHLPDSQLLASPSMK